jgi:large subunit ribosomal protein L14
MNAINLIKRGFKTSSADLNVRLLTRLRVVDNSALGKQAMLEGKPPKVIGVYWKAPQRHGVLGDKVMMAIKGQKKRGYLVGLVARQKTMVPKFDSNNVVLIDDNGNPMGTRVLAPIPNRLRGMGPHFNKILALATKLV